MTTGAEPIYDSYAPIYDLIGQGRFGARMARWTLEWLATHDIRPWRVLDLACGTGAAALVFAEAGYQVVGIDRSAAMLAIARGKARDSGYDVTFLDGDIRGLTTDDRPTTDQRPTTDDRPTKDERRKTKDGRRRTKDEGSISSFIVDRSSLIVSITLSSASFDLATCFYDSLNYLTDDGDLARVFAVVARALRPGGHMVFDLNMEAEYTTWDERAVVTHDGRDCLVYNCLDYDEQARLASGRIVWFVREIDRWWRGEETHIARAWRDAEVCDALDEAGLTLLARFSPIGDAVAQAADSVPRVVYVARRDRGGRA
jgi:SAM-dependent methyltransferase